MRKHIKLLNGLIVLGAIAVLPTERANASDSTPLQEIRNQLASINAEIASRKTATTLLVTNLTPINKEYTIKLQKQAKN